MPIYEHPTNFNMQKIKKRCLRAAARFKNSGFARKGVLALGALTLTVGDMMASSKGAAGFTKATTEIACGLHYRPDSRGGHLRRVLPFGNCCLRESVRPPLCSLQRPACLRGALLFHMLRAERT